MHHAESRLRVAIRCRSKKIRCDGVRPCCSQCSSVGFECKTSDKLSRRAFPRGYTESLEERVRALEGEVRELKTLLDEKDEKIDMLTRIHPRQSSMTLPSPRHSSASPTSAAPEKAALSPSPSKEETFKVQQSPFLMGDGGASSYFAGTSGGKTFLGILPLYAWLVIVNTNFVVRCFQTQSAGTWTIRRRYQSTSTAVNGERKASQAKCQQ